MKIFKYIFLLILVIIIGTTLYVATLDGNFKYTLTQETEAPRSMAFKQIYNFKNWENFVIDSSGSTIAINANKKIQKVDSIAQFDSFSEISGKLITVESVPFSKIKQKMNLSQGRNKAEIYLDWTIQESESSTQLQLSLSGKRNFLAKFYSLWESPSLDKIIAENFNLSLKNLNKYLMREMEKTSVSIDGTTQFSGGYYLYASTATKNNSDLIVEKSQKIIKQVEAYMQRNKLKASGSSITVFNNIDTLNQSVIISAGIPISSRVITLEADDVLTGFIPKRKVLKLTLQGNYKNLTQAWEKAFAYAQQEFLIVDKQAERFMIYVVSSNEEENPANWVTELYLPLEEAESGTTTEELQLNEYN
ncbi:GyrI-like domain-containing protein [Mesonia sp. HuA40]|uniref:GyrI-like domain-containing protein n=1 Tax=Mesonia sp. HuA40 TaxID=2602761 RepID=UPI0011CAC257|nr:GyrI-like domain-containing protein [Mesonia sp. HuA40]TXK73586.1 hypothetical protein FT993_04530 [Mesonia sp. HuA40]